MRLLAIILLGFLWCNLSAQVDPEQIYQAPGRDYVLLSTDTLNSSYPINGIYVPTRLRDSFYFKSDSICIGIFGDGRPDPCLLLPDGGGGPSDTMYYWVFQVNGGTNDTIIQGEHINLVAGTNISITGGTDNPTINAVNMFDTCFHTLTQLTDTTAQLTDCNGADRGTVTFSASTSVGAVDSCFQDLIVSNGIGSDTIFLTDCAGANKDTVVFYPPEVNDSYIDSSFVSYNPDSISIWLYRFDTSGLIDSFPIYLPRDSMDTDSQSLAIDTTTALFTLSRDPTTTPDLLVLPWKDAIRDDYSANYTDSIRHNGNVGINRIPVHPLDVENDDVFQTNQLRLRNPYNGASGMRFERSVDSVLFDFINFGATFDLRRMDVGGSGDFFLRLDTTTTGRTQHYLWHDNEGYLWATDYGKGFHTPNADESNDWSYVLAPRADGKFLEIPFADLIDTLEANGVTTQVIAINGLYNKAPDTVALGGQLIEDTRIRGNDDAPGLTEFSMYFDTLKNYEITASTLARMRKIRTPSLSNNSGYVQTGTGQTSAFYYDFDNNTSGRFLINNTGVFISNGDTSDVDTKNSITLLEDSLYINPSNQAYTPDGIDSGFVLIAQDTLGRALWSHKDSLRLHDYDFVKLQGDTLRTDMRNHLPIDSLDNDSLIFHAGVVRLGDWQYYPDIYLDTVTDQYQNFILYQDSATTGLQIYGKRSAIDIYHETRPYRHIRNSLGEFWDRVFDPTAELGQEPQRWEFGATGKYFIESTETFDTTSRPIFTIRDNSDPFTLNIVDDYIQSAIYGHHTRDRDTIVADSVFVVMSTDNVGNFVLTPIDTIAKKLGVIAAGSVEIDTFFLNANDSIGLDLTGTVAPIQYVDLSSFRLSLTGDTLIQGTDTLFLPQGADSVGTIVTDTRVMYGLGNKTPGFESNFSYNYTDNILELNPGQVYAGQGKFERNGASGNIRLLRTDGAGMAIGGGSSQSTFTFDDSYDFEIRSASRANVEAAVLNAGSQRFAIDGAAGGITFGAYNSTNNTGTPTYLLGTDGSGNVVKRSFANVLSDIGADNYSSWTAGSGSGTRVVTSGSQLDFLGGDSDISTSISGSTVTFSIPANAIQGSEISDATIEEVDLGVTNAPTDNWLLSYDAGTGGFTWVNPSGYAQTFSTSSGFADVHTVSLSGTGSSFTISAGSNITMANEGTSNVSINAANQLQTLSWNSGTSQLTISSGNTVTLSGLGGADGDGIYDGSGTIPNSAVTAQLGGSSSTFTIADDGGGSIFTATPSGSGVLTINVDPTIGANGSDQLKIESDGNWVEIGHESNLGATDLQYLRFSDPAFVNGKVTLLNLVNGNSDIQIQASSDVQIGPTVSVGTSSFPSSAPSYTLFVDNTAGKPGGGSWSDSSDERLKKNINQINSESAIVKILGLRGVNFEWNDNRDEQPERPDGMQYGLIAQDIVKVFGEDPHFVGRDNDNYYTASYGNYDPLFIESFRYLYEQNQQQAAQIKVLTEQINKLYDIVNKKK